MKMMNGSETPQEALKIAVENLNEIQSKMIELAQWSFDADKPPHFTESDKWSVWPYDEEFPTPWEALENARKESR